MVKWWWISFSCEKGFLGAAIVDGESFTEAIANAWKHEINPGGEAQGMELTKAQRQQDLKPFDPYRLYSKQEIEKIDEAVKWG